MAATAPPPRALLLSRFSDLSSLQSSSSSSSSFVSRQNLSPRPSILSTKRSSPHSQYQRLSSSSSRPVVTKCLISGGVDSGGGVADDFVVSTRKTNLDREFSVIGNMLMRIEPLDTSVISKGVSSAAKDSMKTTISSMLGLLPSDQFCVIIRVSKRPLDNLLASSIITGYTLWNAEYRVCLMRNFDISPGSSSCSKEKLVSFGVPDDEVSESDSVQRDGGITGDSNRFGEEEDSVELGEIPQSLGDLSPEALNYIKMLKSELDTLEKELNTQKQDSMKTEFDEEKDDLLEYLRSLDPDMVTELSQSSSPEVEEIIHQLVQNISQRFFKEDAAYGLLEDSDVEETERYPGGDEEPSDAIGTTRDYLAKLLFWCMLLGHHLRSLENRLNLSCVVGLL